MRKIKFRAFDDGKMIYENDILHLNKEDNLIFRLAKFWSNIRSDSYVMQFTGLTDKNAKEIYEGDILKTGTDKPMVVGWSVKFASFVLNRDGWAFSHWFGESCSPEDCEVIGNIHENKELLK